MMEPRNRSPEEWEYEIERTRAGIDRTLTALRLRLSRGAIVDRVMESTRDGGGDFAAGLGRTLRDNPVPALILGAGLAWLVMSSRDNAGGARPALPGPAPRYDPHRPSAVSAAETETPAPAPSFHDAEKRQATGIDSNVGNPAPTP